MQSTIRKQLSASFSEADGEFVSGQTISDKLGCSRTAVWKHMEDLRSEGYELEAVRRLGYRIASKPDKVTANEIQLGLQTKRIGRTVYFEETVESTQHIAAKLAYEGAEGTVVVAEEQTAGKRSFKQKMAFTKRNRDLDEYYFTPINPSSSCTATYFVSGR